MSIADFAIYVMFGVVAWVVLCVLALLWLSLNGARLVGEETNAHSDISDSPPEAAGAPLLVGTTATDGDGGAGGV